jgi:hypothetical protein
MYTQARIHQTEHSVGKSPIGWAKFHQNVTPYSVARSMIGMYQREMENKDLVLIKIEYKSTGKVWLNTRGRSQDIAKTSSTNQVPDQLIYIREICRWSNYSETDVYTSALVKFGQMPSLSRDITKTSSTNRVPHRRNLASIQLILDNVYTSVLVKFV